jgi:hypothetical protein
VKACDTRRWSSSFSLCWKRKQSSKFQAPTSREIPNFKLQTPVSPNERFDVWSLELLWSLDVGAWNFNWPDRISYRASPFVLAGCAQ